MNARLLRCTIGTAVLPLAGTFLMLALKNNADAVKWILLAVTLMQLPMILLCKNALKPFIRPDLKILDKMGVEYVPAPYEPGRYKIDARVSSILLWAGIAAPLMIALAIRHPEEVTVYVVNGAMYTSPCINLLLAALLFLVVGTVALPFWFHTARAAAIYAEGSERKRYLLRGFVDRLDQAGSVREFLNARGSCAYYPLAQKQVEQ